MKHSDAAMTYIRAHLADKGYPPSRRELGKHLGIRSSSQAQDVILALVREGLIEVDPHIQRGIRIKGANMKARSEEFTDG